MLNRYLQKIDRGEPVELDGEIDPSYMEVEKILDYREEEVEEIVDDVAASNNLAALRELEKAKAAVDAQGDDDGQDEEDEIPLTLQTRRNSSRGQDLSSESLPAQEEGKTTIIQIFQPNERCKRVLERIMDDPYAESFIDPVDTSVYEDYLDVVDEAICLSDIEKKLENGDYSKYNQHRQFANDMRKVWRNCKMYNVYKSPIWYSANYLANLFERLYQSWVVSYSDGTLPMSNPLARPWDQTCRVCLKDNHEDKVILCDHCDANYHVYCLSPPLSSVPEDAWMCQRCLKWLARSGAKVLSAIAEEEAKALVEGATSKKVIRVKKKKYLVKWTGLSYKECTWETVEDINDDEKIKAYHKLNDTPPDEPPLTQAEIGVELAKDRKNQPYPSGYQNFSGPVADLDAQIYAQIRSYHFLKCKKSAPVALLKESGPATLNISHGNEEKFKIPKCVADAIQTIESSGQEGEDEEKMDLDDKVENDPMDVVEEDTTKNGDGSTDRDGNDDAENADDETPKLPSDYLNGQFFRNDKDTVDVHRLVCSAVLSEMVYCVARDHEKVPMPEFPSRPVLPSRFQAPSEIEICVRKSKDPLCMKIGNFRGSCYVMGFKPMDDRGTKGPVERTGRIKPGDIVVAINGLYVHEMKYEKVLKLLQLTSTTLSQPYLYLRFLRIPRCIEAKSQNLAEAYFKKKPTPKVSTRALPVRSLYFGVHPAEIVGNETQLPRKWIASFHKKHVLTVVGTFDNEIDAAKAYDAAINSEENDEGWTRNFDADGNLTNAANTLQRVVTTERMQYSTLELGKTVETVTTGGSEAASEQTNKKVNITDVNFQGFHSDDSMDSESDYSEESEEEPQQEDNPFNDDHVEEVDEDDDDDDENDDRPSRDHREKSKPQASFDTEGPMSRLFRAVNECSFPPIKSDWTKFIIELGMAKLTQTTGSSNKSGRIEQIDLVSNMRIRVWSSMHMAARALNIPIKDIFANLSDERDSAGGFKWKYSEDKPSTNEDDEDDEEVSTKIVSCLLLLFDFVNFSFQGAAEKKDDSWQLKLPTRSKEYKNGGTLRDYQVDGLSWLLRCWYLKRSSILADEMGLGKVCSKAL